MSAEPLAPLIERLARARGIGDAYHSYTGELKEFPLTTKAAILRAKGEPGDETAAREALALFERKGNVVGARWARAFADGAPTRAADD